jgi:hypothetical protein
MFKILLFPEKAVSFTLEQQLRMKELLFTLVPKQRIYRGYSPLREPFLFHQSS